MSTKIFFFFSDFMHYWSKLLLHVVDQSLKLLMIKLQNLLERRKWHLYLSWVLKKEKPWQITKIQFNTIVTHCGKCVDNKIVDYNSWIKLGQCAVYSNFSFIIIYFFVISTHFYFGWPETNKKCLTQIHNDYRPVALISCIMKFWKTSSTKLHFSIITTQLWQVPIIHKYDRSVEDAHLKYFST